HPNVELALIFLVGVLRELCALSSHPPCVVGFRSHRTCFLFCRHPAIVMICLSRSASVRSATQRELFLCLRAGTIWNEMELSAFIIKREKGHAALLLPSQLRRSHRAGRRRR